MRTIALDVQNIHKTFSVDGGTIEAVADVSFQVRAGEFVALVGPSGSGKTTLLSILAALLTASSGAVRVDGQDLARMTEKQRVELRRKKIGFTFQTNNLIPYLTALENVEFMLRLNGLNGHEGRKRSKDLLERLGLGDRLNNLPGQMSGGQQQRVAIARALIHNPAVVLADEPTASLDTQHAFQVVEAFSNLVHEDGHAGVMVTHDLRMCRYVDRVLQMLDGKLVREYKNRKDIDRLAKNGM
jgi:putative ABC transport system ATP-binding protein